MKHKNKKLIIPLPTVIFFVILLTIYRDYFTVLTLLSALMHELGHLFCIRLLDLDIEKITVFPFGADIRLAPSLRSYKTELSVSLSGPVVNLFICIIFLRVVFIPEIAVINLVLAGMNLFPVNGLDGGKALYSFLVMHAEESTAEKILRITSFVSVFCFWVFSTFILLKGDGNPSLFVISCLLFVSVFLNRKADAARKMQAGSAKTKTDENERI